MPSRTTPRMRHERRPVAGSTCLGQPRSSPRTAPPSRTCPGHHPARPPTGPSATPRHDATTPGETVRAEGGPATGDLAVDEAYDGLGATWELWSAAYGSDSLDGKGMPLLATVHYGDRYDNAFWDGAQMVFGDGDGVVFERFTKSLDVIGHELAHGVTEHTAGLSTRASPGRSTSRSPTSSGCSSSSARSARRAAEADWLVGAELLTPAVQGRALRDMHHPGTAYDDPNLGTDPSRTTWTATSRPRRQRRRAHQLGHPQPRLRPRRPRHRRPGLGGRGRHLAGRADRRRHPADCDFATFAELTVAAAVTATATVRPAHGGARRVAQVGVLQRAERPLPTRDAADRSARADRPTARCRASDAEVLLRRTGGFAGRVRERRMTIGDLAERDARDWQHLLAAPTLQQIAAIPAADHPDAFCYDVVCAQVDLDVTVPEPHLPEAIHQLFERTLSAG